MRNRLRIMARIQEVCCILSSLYTLNDTRYMLVMLMCTNDLVEDRGVHLKAIVSGVLVAMISALT